MSRAVFCTVTLSFILALQYSDVDAEILLAPEPQRIPQGAKAEFHCLGRGSMVQWLINSQVINHNNIDRYTRKGFEFEQNRTSSAGDLNSNKYKLTLRVPANAENNLTEVKCRTSGDAAVSEPVFLVVLGRPSPVEPKLQPLHNATILLIQWSPPFVWEGYDITEYEISVRNLSTGGDIKSPEDGTTKLTLQLRSPQGQIAQSCHELSITITANSPLGRSDPVTISAWFPIAPGPFSSPPEIEVLYPADKLPEAKVTFGLPQLCPSQTVNYTLIIQDTVTQDIIDTEHRSYYPLSEGAEVTRDIKAGLELDKTYKVTVTVETITGKRSAVTEFSTRLGQEELVPPEQSEYEQTSEEEGKKEKGDDTVGIAVGFAVGGVVAISILLGLVTASVIVLHRLHRKAGGDASEDEEKPKAMASNPLFEEPLYDTIDDFISAIPQTQSRPETPAAVKEPPYVSLFPTYENSCIKTTAETPLQAGDTVVSEDSYTLMNAAPVVKYSKVQRVRHQPAVNSSEGSAPNSDVIQSRSTYC